MRKKTIEEFIVEANKIHNNKYNYSKVEYKNIDSKIIITCPIHGDFIQTPYHHLHSKGCQKCNDRFMDVNYFKEKASIIHKNKYDYSEVVYVNNTTNVKIKCPIHGDFEQTPSNHLAKKECIECSKIKKIEKQRTSDIDFILEANKIHKDKYDYSKINYKNNHTNIIIICPIHGDFKQIPSNHLAKKGCPDCGNDNIGIALRLSNDEFIKRAINIHGSDYDYSYTNYVDAKTKIEINCNEHGMFKQNPFDHLSGYGCPKCSESKGEKIIRKFLENNNIIYEKEKTFDDCRNVKLLSFDFYLNKSNLLIEYDGSQHFKPIEYFGGIDSFLKQLERDKIKNDYAKSTGRNLIRIAYNDNIEDKLYNLLPILV